MMAPHSGGSMRLRVAIALFAVAVLGVSLAGQKGKHLNPMIDLLEAGKPVFGVAIPTTAGKTPVDRARDAIAYRNADYFFTGSMERNVDGPGRNGGPSP